jgi:cell division transport system permease protein
MLVLTKRIFRAGWRNFSRDGGQNAATIFILVMVISVITSLFLFKQASQFLISSIQEKVDISVYFKYGASEEDILNIKNEIAGISEVKEVKYVSKEEAFKNFTEKHKDNQILMESLDEVGMNPFLASLSIKASEASQYQAVADFLGNSKFDSIVEKVDYYQRKPIIERIFSLTSNLNKAGILFSIILAIFAMLIVFNTVRLAIYSSKEEIKIQRLVGASNRFIRGPFLVQGAISGIFATLISLSLSVLVCRIFGPKLEILFPGLNLFKFFIADFWLILLIQLFAGLGVGLISSSIAVRRYLKV